MEPVAYLQTDPQGGSLFFRNKPEILATLPLWLTADQVQIDRMAEILQRIAYPRRGTDDDQMTIQDAANLVQEVFSQETLESFRGAR